MDDPPPDKTRIAEEKPARPRCYICRKTFERCIDKNCSLCMIGRRSKHCRCECYLAPGRHIPRCEVPIEAPFGSFVPIPDVINRSQHEDVVVINVFLYPTKFPGANGFCANPTTTVDELKGQIKKMSGIERRRQTLWGPNSSAPSKWSPVEGRTTLGKVFAECYLVSVQKLILVIEIEKPRHAQCTKPCSSVAVPGGSASAAPVPQRPPPTRPHTRRRRDVVESAPLTEPHGKIVESSLVTEPACTSLKPRTAARRRFTKNKGRKKN